MRLMCGCGISQVLGEGVCVQWLLVAREEYPCVVGSLHQGVGGIAVLWRRGRESGKGERMREMITLLLMQYHSDCNRDLTLRLCIGTR